VNGPLPQPRVVLICLGCQTAWEASGREADDRSLSFALGCTHCGDWLYLAELAEQPIPLLPTEAGR
jgi:hypothetical protein